MTANTFLNSEVLNNLDAAIFQSATPFPWANPQNFVRSEKFTELVEALPSRSDFRPFFGKKRKHGQVSHDRYVLDYDSDIKLSPVWETFIGELRSSEYRAFIARLLNVRDVSFRFHWHYTPAGAQVSPHCDSRGKLGSHIFYFNTADDWRQEWGGETVLLDDENRFTPDSSPAFDDFSAVYPAKTLNNHSLIFGRRGNSWHGVRRLDCPEDYYRKVFIVVFYGDKPSRVSRFKTLRRNLLTRFSDKSKARKVKTERF